MKKTFPVTVFFAVVLLVFSSAPGHADVGFGIPDMVEEQVDELDEKVRKHQAQQNDFPALQPFTIAAGDSSIVIREVVISRDAKRIYVLAEDTADTGLTLSLLDGSGEIENNNSLISGTSSEHLTLLSSGRPVVLSQNTGDSTISPLTIFEEDLEGFPTTDLWTDTYTTLALDSSDDIYGAGTAGVRKTSSDLDIDTPTIWRDTNYRVPEDNLITKGDSVFITNLSETTGTPDSITLQLLALDQNDGSVDWNQTLLDYTASDLSGTSYLTIGSDRLHVMFHESRSGDEFDTMFVRNIDDGSNVKTVTYQNVGEVSDNSDPVPTVVGNGDQIYAGDKGGTVFQFNSDGSYSGYKIGISDSPTIPWIIDDSDSIYMSVQADTQGAVFAADKVLSDSAAVFVSSSDTLPVNTRPVWLTEGFLGIVFSGGRFSVNETPFDGSELENGSWPHRYRDNQATRFKN